MYNIDNLEKQWVHYKRKKVIRYTFFVSFVIFVMAAGFYLSNQETFISEATKVQLSKKNQKSSTSGKQEENHRGKIATLKTEVPSLTKRKERTHPKPGQIIFQDSGYVSPKKKNLLIQVTERGGKDIATDIENRFEFAKDKSDSLFLAKYYYDKVNYSKAEKWALETNKLDNTVEESWIIFAKSKAKQGERVEALRVLRAFIDQRGSAKAQALMDKIRRGRQF